MTPPMIRRNIAAVALRRSTGVRPSKDCVVATRLFSSNSFSGTSALEQQFAEEGLRLPDYYFRSTPSVRPAPTSSPMVPRPSAAGASSQHESSSSSSSVEKFTVEDRSDAGARTNSSQHFSGQKSAQPIWKSGLSDRSTAAPELPSAPANAAAIQQNASQPPTSQKFWEVARKEHGRGRPGQRAQSDESDKVFLSRSQIMRTYCIILSGAGSSLDYHQSSLSIRSISDKSRDVPFFRFSNNLSLRFFLQQCWRSLADDKRIIRRFTGGRTC